MLTSSQSSDLVIVCFSMFWRSTLLHEVLWFCTRDVLSQKWPSSNPPSSATFRNLLLHFLMPWHPAEGFLLKKHNKSQECKIAYRYILYFPFFSVGFVSVLPLLLLHYFEVVTEHWCGLPSVPLITKGKLHIFWFRREWMDEVKVKKKKKKLLNEMAKFKKIWILKKRIFKEVWRESRMSDEDFISMCWLAFFFLWCPFWLFLHEYICTYWIDCTV